MFVPYYDPEINREMQRRTKMAEAMMKSSQQPQQTEVVGGYAVPQSPLAGLARAIQGGMGAYNEGKAGQLEMQQQKSRGEMLADAMQRMGGNPEEAASILMQDPATQNMAVQIYGDAARNKQMLEVAKIRAGGQGGSYVDPVTGEIVMQPQRPKLSSTAEKELFDTVDIVNQGQGAASDLERARKLASNIESPIYSGFGSDIITSLNRVPVIGGMIDDDRATNTTEYNNLITGQALSSMKSIFGGNPTEGERAILLQMQAMSNKTPQEQAAILENAQRAVDRRNQFNQSKAQAIQSGDRSALINIGMQQPTPAAEAQDPRIAKALAAGYSMDEIKAFMGGGQ